MPGLLMAGALALGGCEVLAGLGLDDGAQAGDAVAANAAKPPPPPPPAPRLNRLASRRGGGERAGEPASGGEPSVDPLMAAAPRGAVERDPTAEAAPAPAPIAAPERVVGLAENDLAAWLGEPANRREESPARVWRYAGDGCVLDVFFYLDLVSRQFRALSYEIRNANGDDQRCLSPVFAGRGDPPRAAARRAD